MEWLAVSSQRKRGLHTQKRRTLAEHMREMLAPSMGWQAFGRWVLLKLKRQASNPRRVAGGFALGMYINFLPIPGLGGLSALLTAWLLRLNLPAAFIGQIPSNPLTFPLLFAVNYSVGRLVMPVPDDSLRFAELLKNFNWTFIWQNGPELASSVLLPIFIGGQILGIPLALLSYWLVEREMRAFNRWRRERTTRITSKRSAGKSQTKS